MIEKLIQELGKDLDMQEYISSSEANQYILPFEENIDVIAMEAEGRCLLKGVIGACPRENTEAFLMRTMESNLFGIGTRGAVIGLDDEGKLLTLTLELEYNTSYKEFKERLEDFISVLDAW